MLISNYANVDDAYRTSETLLFSESTIVSDIHVLLSCFNVTKYYSVKPAIVLLHHLFLHPEAALDTATVSS